MMLKYLLCPEYGIKLFPLCQHFALSLVLGRIFVSSSNLGHIIALTCLVALSLAALFNFILDMTKNYLFCAITGCIALLLAASLTTNNLCFIAVTILVYFTTGFHPQYDNKLLSLAALAATLIQSKTATHPQHDDSNCHVTCLITIITESLIWQQTICPWHGLNYYHWLSHHPVWCKKYQESWIHFLDYQVKHSLLWAAVWLVGGCWNLITPVTPLGHSTLHCVCLFA